MKKAARKKLRKDLVKTVLMELKKRNLKAASKAIKQVEKAAKTIVKKFAKSAVALQKSRPIKPKSITVKKPARKAIPQAITKPAKEKK